MHNFQAYFTYFFLISEPKGRIEYEAQSKKPFDDVTTARADYQPHPYHKPEPCYKPQIQYKPCKAKFEAGTTATDAYQTWPVQRRSRPVWAVPKATGQGMATSLIKTSSYQVNTSMVIFSS